jgi:hypothetical protein
MGVVAADFVTCHESKERYPIPDFDPEWDLFKKTFQAKRHTWKGRVHDAFSVARDLLPSFVSRLTYCEYNTIRSVENVILAADHLRKAGTAAKTAASYLPLV